jgi:hypothetical protein
MADTKYSPTDISTRQEQADTPKRNASKPQIEKEDLNRSCIQLQRRRLMTFEKSGAL